MNRRARRRVEARQWAKCHKTGEVPFEDYVGFTLEQIGDRRWYWPYQVELLFDLLPPKIREEINDEYKKYTIHTEEIDYKLFYHKIIEKLKKLGFMK